MEFLSPPARNESDRKAFVCDMQPGQVFAVPGIVEYDGYEQGYCIKTDQLCERNYFP